MNVYNNVLCYWRKSTAGEPRYLVFELCCIIYFYYNCVQVFLIGTDTANVPV